jgi:NADH-quinone oxidoreductase subunit E
MLGADALCHHVAAAANVRVGETGTDGRFTVLPIVCLGACDHAPTLMVDGDLHGDVEPAHVEEILRGYP